MKTGEDFLTSKGWDPNNPQVGGALFKGIAQLFDEYRLEVLESVKLGFDICSDHSTFCLGYRNLCDRIRREKSHEPLDKNISAVKSITEEELFRKIREDEIEESDHQ